MCDVVAEKSYAEIPPCVCCSEVQSNSLSGVPKGNLCWGVVAYAARAGVVEVGKGEAGRTDVLIKEWPFNVV